MSLIFATRYKKNENLLFQDLYFVKKSTLVRSEIIEAACSVCEKGLRDGMSVTAKKIRQKSKFFCQYHIPLDFH